MMLLGPRIRSSCISLLKLSYVTSYSVRLRFLNLVMLSLARSKKSWTRKLFIVELELKSLSTLVILLLLLTIRSLFANAKPWWHYTMLSLWSKSSRLLVISYWLRRVYVDSLRLLPAPSRMDIRAFRQSDSLSTLNSLNCQLNTSYSGSQFD